MKSFFCVRAALAGTFFLASLPGGQDAFCQQKGHFAVSTSVETIIGGSAADNPSNLMYSIEGGITYDILERLRLHGAFGGFRSLLSYYGSALREEPLMGPQVSVGADYLFGSWGRHVRPVGGLSLGFRYVIPSSGDEPLYEQNPAPGMTDNRYIPYVRTNDRTMDVESRIRSGADGAFLRAGLGADILIGEVCLNVALTGELTEFFTGGIAKGTGERFGRPDRLKDGTEVFRAGKAPFWERLRGAVGLSLRLMLP